MDWVGLLGRGALGAFVSLLVVAEEVYLALKSYLLEKGRGRSLVYRIFINQVRFTGVEALPRISFTALTLGAVVVVNAVQFLPAYTSWEFVSRAIMLILVKELSPIIIALVLIGRSGTAISTELANMKLNKEVEALDGLGINVHYYLILPRVLGFVLSIVCLVIYFNVVSVLGGFFIAHWSGVAPAGFQVTKLFEGLATSHIVVSVVKAGLFGTVIAAIACHQGLSVKVSFREVPQVTTRAVVNSMVLCFLINSIISLMF